MRSAATASTGRDKLSRALVHSVHEDTGRLAPLVFRALLRNAQQDTAVGWGGGGCGGEQTAGLRASAELGSAGAVRCGLRMARDSGTLHRSRMLVPMTQCPFRTERPATPSHKQTAPRPHRGHKPPQPTRSPPERSRSFALRALVRCAHEDVTWLVPRAFADKLLIARRVDCGGLRSAAVDSSVGRLETETEAKRR